MRLFFFLGLYFFCCSKIFAQINPADSTHQVIGYWDKNEKQSYLITLQNYRVKGSDTTSRTMITYEVDVTIKDSTEQSYTIEWVYKNFNIKPENEFAKNLAATSNNMKVVFKTDEMGAFREVVNWKEIKDFMQKTTSDLKKQYKGAPNIEQVISQTAKMYSDKSTIEAGAIQDIQQFYTWYGARYKLGEELKGNVKVANLHGGAPFDAELTIVLDEVNFEEENSILRMWQTTNSEQLTNAAFDQVKENAKKAGKKAPKKKDVPLLQNETRAASRIHGPSGWIIYSIHTKEVWSGDNIAFEERIIDLK